MPWYQGGKCKRLPCNMLMPLDDVQEHTLPSLKGFSCIKVPGKEVQEVLSAKASSKIPILYAIKKISKDLAYKNPRCANPILCHPAASELKTKVPVLKKPVRLAPLQSSEPEKHSFREKNLPASVRRQKFHQSRHPILANDAWHTPYQICTTSALKNNSHELYNQINSILVKPVSNLKPKLSNLHYQKKEESLVNHKQNFQIQPFEPVAKIVASQRELLPPVLPAAGKSTARTESQLSKKRKNLLGEITHFPAVCNILPSRTGKVISISTVPTLPSILPSPPAPPPSISASLEQEAVNKNISHEVRMESLVDKSLVKEGEMISKHLPNSVEGDLLSPIMISDCKHSPFLHTVSIVVDPVDFEIGDSNVPGSSNVEMNDQAMKSDACENIVKTVMDLAELRREEFARLLDEHAQIVREIQRAESENV